MANLEFGPCEAPFHVKNCNGKGSTKDHFTPKVIAKLLDWTPEQIGARENIQMLSPQCHHAKDLSTPTRYYLLRRQLRKGTTVLFGEHNRFIDSN